MDDSGILQDSAQVWTVNRSKRTFVVCRLSFDVGRRVNSHKRPTVETMGWLVCDKRIVK